MSSVKKNQVHINKKNFKILICDHTFLMFSLHFAIKLSYFKASTTKIPIPAAV